MDTTEHRHGIALAKCRTFGQPAAISLRLKASDVEITMSLDQMKSRIYGSSAEFFFLQQVPSYALLR